MFNVRGTLKTGKEFKMVAKSSLIHEAAVDVAQQLAKATNVRNPADLGIERVTFTAPEAVGGGLVLKEKRERKPKDKK